MEIREVKFYDCKLDSDFKENKEGAFNTIAKTMIGEFENIILLEITKDQYEYLNSIDYKNLLFNIKGHMQIRKNKKDIPFLFFKANYIQSLDDLKKLKQAKRKKKKKKNDLVASLNWHEKIELLDYEKIENFDCRKIKLVDEEHLIPCKLEFNPKYLQDRELKAVIKKIEETDRFELILGWKDLLSAKFFDRDLSVYIVKENRKELVEKLSKIDSEVVQEQLQLI